MIDKINNIIQITVLLFCVCFAVYKAVIYKSRSWTMLAFVYGSWCLGDIYWLLCIIFYDNAPQVSVVSDLSWYASYIFLYLLLRNTFPPEEISGIKTVCWLGPVFTVIMGAFFMLWGEIVNNLIYAGLMGLLLFSVIRRLAEKKQNGHSRLLSIMILIFCLLEYALWTASCFWTDDILLHPYYWFDFLLTVSLIFFLPAVKKAVAQ